MAQRKGTLKNGSIAARLAFIQKRLPTVRDRALASTLRGVKTEASKLVSESILNLPARTISGTLSATVSKADSAIVVGASKTRIPLQQFKPSVSSSSGVTVTTWKDRGAQQLPHAFRRKDGKPGIWQRVPFTFAKGQSGAGPSGLVHRLQIVERKGPSMHRIFLAKHGDIVPALTAFAQAQLSIEVQRMLKAGL